MGSGGAKKTNQLLEQQRGMVNQQSNVMGNRSENEYAGRSGLRDKINEELWNRMGSAPELSGGSAGRAAGWAGQPYEEIYGKYKNLSETGGWTDAEKNRALAVGTAPIAGMYQGMQNKLQRANNATGGFAGYGSQQRAMGRDTAREGGLMANTVNMGIEADQRNRRETGMGGMLSTTNSGWREAQAGSAGSAGGVGTQDYYLRQLMGQQGQYEDLPYAQLQQNGLNQGTNIINSRQNETPMWQKALLQTLPSAASSAIGAFSNPIPKAPQLPTRRSGGNLNGLA